MDFIWTDVPDQLDLLVRSMDRVGVDVRALTVRETGSWGTLVATATPYRGLQPLVDAGQVLVVVGDPLLKLDVGPDVEDPSHRTRAIARLWDGADPERSNLRPHHPAALLRVEHTTGRTELMLDAFGGVPVFSIRSHHAAFVATTPDLLAATTGPSLDPIGSAELLAAGRISFPNTLYRGVLQLRPGARHDLSSGVVDPWWTPPLPEDAPDPSDWARLIEGSVRETMQRISDQVGSGGQVTLSAGRDTRAVAALAASGLSLEAVVLTGAPNLESWTAGRVARRLGIPIRKRLRPRNHYGDLLLARPLVFGTQNGWMDAHFHHGVLGTSQDDAFVLGGYNADTLFRKGGLSYKSRARTKRWAVSDIVDALPGDVVESIETRWAESAASMGITPQHSESIGIEFPFTQRGTAAHFHAARRNGPQYEVFLTEPCLALGFRIPDAQKGTRLERALFRAELQRFRGIPINPGEGWLSARVLRILSVLVPRALAPAGLRVRGPWSTPESPFADPSLSGTLFEAVEDVERLLQVSGVDRERLKVLSVCLQIRTAAELSEGVARPPLAPAGQAPHPNRVQDLT